MAYLASCTMTMPLPRDSDPAAWKDIETIWVEIATRVRPAAMLSVIAASTGEGAAVPQEVSQQWRLLARGLRGFPLVSALLKPAQTLYRQAAPFYKFQGFPA